MCNPTRYEELADHVRVLKNNGVFQKVKAFRDISKVPEWVHAQLNAINADVLDGANKFKRIIPSTRELPPVYTGEASSAN